MSISVLRPVVPNTCYQISTNIKIVKSLKFSVKTGPIYKMLKYRDEWAFVSPRGGLGGPPSFVAC
jgi:hypothetical protein